jgi:hypothetical protein
MPFFVPRRSPVQDHDVKTIHELVHLLAEQRETLESVTFGCGTEMGMRDFDARKERINELYAQLFKPGSVK